MTSVHDSIILSYLVDFESDTLVINSLYQDGNANEKTTVTFTGYLAHVFENEMKNSIIFDIEECPLSNFLEENQELLEKRKNFGWPILYEAYPDLIGYLQLNQYKAFSISSSLGLYGWVLAKRIDISGGV